MPRWRALVLLLASLLTGCATFGVARCPEPAPSRELVSSPLASRIDPTRVREQALKRVSAFDAEPPRVLGFSGDGNNLIAAGYDVAAVRWDLSARKIVDTIKPPEGGILRFFLALEANRGRVALRDGTRAAIYDMKGTRIYALDGHEGASEYSEPVDSAAFSPDGNLVATGDDVGTLRIWSLADGKRIGAISLGNDRLGALAFSPNSRLVAAAVTNDEVVRLVDVRAGEVIATLPTAVEEIYHVDFSRDGSRLVAADFTEAVAVWELDRCQRIDLEPPDDFANDVKISPDGTVVGAAVSQGFVLWDARTGKQLVHVRTGKGISAQSAFRALAFSPLQTTIAIGSDRGVSLMQL
jgi:WD40 repeat protein